MGDLTLARGVAAEIRSRQRSPWSHFPADIGLIGNLEGALAEAEGATCAKEPPLCLGISEAELRLLPRARFLAVSLENNHSRDFGEAARAALVEKLRALGVEPITAETAPISIEVGAASARVRWGLVALDLTAPDSGVRQLALERARLEVGRAAAEADHVAVLLHAGIEGSSTVTVGQRATASLLQAWGADVIVGSHPHRVQEVACSLGGIAAYSLGDHLFDGMAPSSWSGAALTCCTTSGATVCSTERTERTRPSSFPKWTDDAIATPCQMPARPVDARWRVHRHRDRFAFVQRMKSAGDGAFLALHRQFSTFDHELALRPYVFRVEGDRTIDLWRGTALAFPLVAARLIEVKGRELLCALHRGDSFMVPRLETLERRWVVYRWTGFGFESVQDDEAARACKAL